MVYAQHRIQPRKWDAQNSQGFWDTNGSSNLGQMNRAGDKSKFATIVESEPKAPFSIATTQRCRGERYSIPWIAPLYPWSLPYSAEC